jgi:hypothetical protein
MPTPRSCHQEAALTVPDSAPRAGDQLALIGPARPVRLPAELWRTWLADPNIVARFEAKRFRLSPDTCFPWLGAVSSTGHGSFRAASLPGRSRRGTVPAHLFAYQLAHGVVPRLGWSSEDDPVVCHRCDSHGCTNPDHLPSAPPPRTEPNGSTATATPPARSPTSAAPPDEPAPSPKPSATASPPETPSPRSRPASRQPRPQASPSPSGNPRGIAH